MEQKALISVIVPVYNVESYLPRCVDSICSQTYQNLEIILVDDGSPDTSGRICDDYASRDPRVRVIHKENGGLSSARNAGMDIAQGEYIAFVDSDDWIEPQSYETMLRAMQQHDVLLACGGRYDVDGATGQKRVGLCPVQDECISAQELVGRIFIWDNCDSSACDKLYHRSLLENFRYPEGLVSEDVPVTYRIILQTDRVVMCALPFYNYFHRPGSITNSSLSAKTFHFAEHTLVIYPYICRNYPEIQEQARYFRVRSLVYSMQRIDLASESDRRLYRVQYRTFRKMLCKHLPKIMCSPYFTNRERLDCLFLTAGLYFWSRKLYHLLK